MRLSLDASGHVLQSVSSGHIARAPLYETTISYFRIPGGDTTTHDYAIRSQISPRTITTHGNDESYYFRIREFGGLTAFQRL